MCDHSITPRSRYGKSPVPPVTQSMPKCLTMVNGASILERLVFVLNQHGFKRLVIVTGHLEHCIREFLGTRAGSVTSEYIFSPLYETTNKHLFTLDGP